MLVGSPLVSGSLARGEPVRAVLPVTSRVGAAPAVAATQQAPEVFGVLRGSTPPTPLGGVVVTATRTRDGVVVGRTVSAPSGSFRLAVGTDSVVVRALRIGQRPVTLFLGRLAAGERRDVGQVLANDPVVIATVRVREPARCGAPRDDGSVVSALFADALTALVASVSTMEGGAPVMRTLDLDEERDRRDRLQAVSRFVVREGAMAQPYRSVPVPTLLREGFVVTDALGDQVYRAPDAVVLTDDRFLAGTCLSLDRSREQDGVVGIAFAPARRTRDRIDALGVLWLDATTRTLQRLEFGYVGLPSASASMNPGGTVEYMQLPDGRWIIDRWELRMPTLVLEQVAAPAGRVLVPQMRAVGSKVARGVVSEVRLAETLLYSIGGVTGESALLQELHGELHDAARAVDSLASAVALRRCEVAPGASTHPVTVRVVDQSGSPRAGVRVDAEWRNRLVRSGSDSWAWEREGQAGDTDARGEVVLCAVSRTHAVEVRARSPGCAPVRVPLRPSRGAETSALELRLPRGCGG